MTATDSPGPNEGPGGSADRLGLAPDEFADHLRNLGMSIAASMQPIVEQMAAAVADLAAAFGEAWSSMLDAVTSVIDFTDAYILGTVPVYAVRRLGITEVDVRDWSLDHVRMWNGRRIPIDKVAVAEWLIDERHAGRM